MTGLEIHQLVHPYYWINLILCLSFLTLRLTDPICHWTFGDTWESKKQEDCELDMRENEVLFFLLIVIMIRYLIILLWVIFSIIVRICRDYSQNICNLFQVSKDWEHGHGDFIPLFGFRVRQRCQHAPLFPQRPPIRAHLPLPFCPTSHASSRANLQGVRNHF